MMSEGEQRPPLEWDLRQHSEENILILTGEISERMSLDGVAGQIPRAKPLAIDTHGIKRINSVGVREWVNFLRSLQDAPYITLIRCSPAVVAQLNSVYNFRANATVKSVAAPFFCPQCDVEQLEIIPIGVSVRSPADLIAGTHACRRCGARLEFDDLPDRYFVFLQNTGFFAAIATE